MRKVLSITALLCLAAVSASAWPWSDGKEEPVLVKIGHVGHDHHLALFMALDNSKAYEKQTGLSVRTVEDKHIYELLKGGKKIADLEIVKVGGGSKMPTALAQEVIDIGFGGAAPTLASVDQGSPVRLIAPLHYKGDMFVLKPDYPASNWQEFAASVRKAEAPVKIGYKSPNAVAKIIFEDALKHEGLSFSGDASKTDVEIQMVNCKEDGKLNASLTGGLIDGYVGNNPFPAIGASGKILKIVSDLEDLPPKKFLNHPCCCIAANTAVLKNKGDVIAELMKLFILATDHINQDLESSVKTACRWIGTTEEVERMSIPTSGYSMADSEEWHANMDVWFKAMNGLSLFKGSLKDLNEKQAAAIAYDLSALHKARKEM